MHEQWKKRKMFSNREQGIMSGLDPVPMVQGGYVPYPAMQMGGVVPPHTHPEMHSHSTSSRGIDPGFIRERNPETGVMLPKMQVGGVVPEEPSIEERVAALAAAQGISVGEARGQLLQATAEQQGLSLPETAVQQFSVGLISLSDALSQGIPKMQVGGVVPQMGAQLFEEGDAEVNDALNNLANITKPDVPDTPATDGTSVVKETITEDQGPSSIEKEPFQRMAINIVKQATEMVKKEDYTNVDEVQAQVKEELNAIDDQYRLQTGATDSILTEDFLNLLDRITAVEETMKDIPKMKEGTTKDQAAMMDIEAFIRNLGGGVAGNPEKVKDIIKTYKEASAGSEEAQQELQRLARRGAMLSGKSLQGGVSGLMDVLGQADLAEAEVLSPMPKQMSANEAAMDRLALELETNLYSGTTGSGMTAEARNLLLLQKVMSLPDGPQKDMLLDRFNVDTEAKIVKDFAIKIASDLGKLTPSELKKWKRANGFDSGEELTIAEIAARQAQALAGAISSSDGSSASANNASSSASANNAGGNPGV